MTLTPLTGAYAANSAAIAKQARSFETMAISQLLQPIFDTVSTPSPCSAAARPRKPGSPSC